LAISAIATEPALAYMALIMTPTSKSTAPRAAGEERLAKRLARAGLCSRREAERWIVDGRIAVDGKTIRTPAFNVGPDARVAVDGAAIPASEPTRLWRYHKPRGLLTTNRDEAGRPTIFERLPDSLPRVISVGRLDFNTEGLLLLTNDGDLARNLEHPKTGWLRRYRIRVQGEPTPKTLSQLAAGKTVVDGVAYGAVDARLDRAGTGNSWLTVRLREGKNREIRKIFGHFGHPVSRLLRVAYGPFQLGNLARGAVEEVGPAVLRDQLGSLRPPAPKRDHAHRRR